MTHDIVFLAVQAPLLLVPLLAKLRTPLFISINWTLFGKWCRR